MGVRVAELLSSIAQGTPTTSLELVIGCTDWLTRQPM